MMYKLYNENLLNAIGNMLLSRRQTVSIAESVTSGFLQAALSNIPDASSFFQGGITAYNLSQKYKHLNVEPIHAQEVNCVSAKVAQEMAIHCIRLFGSDWGLAVTGYASRVPASGNELFAFYAICFQDSMVTEGRIIPPADEPQAVQLFYVNEIISKWKAFLDLP